MTFQWPEFLWLMAALPLLVALYVWILHRKKKIAVRYASLGLLKEAMSAHQGLRRHAPPLLMLCGLAVMIAAVARPQAVATLPSQNQIVILAMDGSGSMRATDVA